MRALKENIQSIKTMRVKISFGVNFYKKFYLDGAQGQK